MAKTIYFGGAAALAALFVLGGASASTETVLYGFKGGTDGDGIVSSCSPVGGLTLASGGALYGMTGSGGKGFGTVFKLTPPSPGRTAWTETVLYRFKGGSDGAGPSGGLAKDSRGNLYGTTLSIFGACIAGEGTAFKLAPPPSGETTWTETVIATFTGGNGGAYSVGGLFLGAGGTLYGTTLGDGLTGAGTVFALTPPSTGGSSWASTVLYNFGQVPGDGAGAGAGVIQDSSGALYGTTSAGGAAGAGTVFKLKPPAKGETAWTEQLLYSFKADPDVSFFTAVSGLVRDSKGNLYGVTNEGGAMPFAGSAFKLTPPATGTTAWTETVLYRFKGGADVANPATSLIRDSSGALYGTTAGGIDGGYGTIFKLTPPAAGQTAWKETVLYRFQGGVAGETPEAGLVRDSAGLLYGTTDGGGPINGGTIFKFAP